MASFGSRISKIALGVLGLSSSVGTGWMFYSYTKEPKGSVLDNLLTWKFGEKSYRDFIYLLSDSKLNNETYTPSNNLFNYQIPQRLIRPGLIVREFLEERGGSLLLEDRYRRALIRWLSLPPTEKDQPRSTKEINKIIKKAIHSKTKTYKTKPLFTEFYNFHKQKEGKMSLIRLPGTNWSPMGIAIYSLKKPNVPDSEKVNPLDNPDKYYWMCWLCVVEKGHLFEFSTNYPDIVLRRAMDVYQHKGPQNIKVSSHSLRDVDIMVDMFSKATIDPHRIVGQLTSELLFDYWNTFKKEETSNIEFEEYFGKSKNASAVGNRQPLTEEIIRKNKFSVEYPPIHVKIGEGKLIVQGIFHGQQKLDYFERKVLHYFIDAENNVIRKSIPSSSITKSSLTKEKQQIKETIEPSSQNQSMNQNE